MKKYDKIFKKLEKYQEIRQNISDLSMISYNQAFDIEYTHDSTAIEGNTLSLIETKVVIEDGISVGGKYLREIYEVINHHKAFEYVRDCIIQKKVLDENIIKDIHALLMENIMIGGVYRMVNVYISGAKKTPPPFNEMYNQIQNFYEELRCSELNAIELAAWTHAEFVRIHPFSDGNGRTARLIMNYQLMINGFLPISIKKYDRIPYFDALEKYVSEQDLNSFCEIILDLENKQLDNYLNMNK